MNDDLTPWQRQTLRLAVYRLAPDDAAAGAMRDLYARFALAFGEWLVEHRLRRPLPRVQGDAVSDAPFTVELSAGTPERMDGLCPICLRPSLWRVPVLILSPQGDSEVGHIEICDGCEAP